MARIIDGRMTHRHEGELVVFHIGMQINKWWRPDVWLPVFGAMPPMLRELSTDPESGFLGYELLRPTAGDDRYFVYTRWESEEAFAHWRDGGAAAAAHAGERAKPVSSGADLMEFEVVLHVDGSGS